MLITPVDHEPNLFQVHNAVSADLVAQIQQTDWLSQPWTPQEGQESWSRRRLINTSIAWIGQWDQEIAAQWNQIETAVSRPLQPYGGTAWWVDEPGFTCAMHTDGEMPGSMHLVWQGPGTAFYWYKDPTTLRWQTPSTANAGYVMINQPDADGSRKLLWHAMLTPSTIYRVTSYTWIVPQ